MKAATISGYEAPVIITEIDKPSLKSDSVLMKVHAAGLNPIDNGLRSGALKESMPLSFPYVMGRFDSLGEPLHGVARHILECKEVKMKRVAAIEARTGQSAVTMACELKVNGQTRQLEIDPRTTLLDALREHLKLTGSKKGCDHGQCGACTVLVAGRRVNACLMLAVMAEGA